MDAFLENLAYGHLRLMTCQPQPRRWQSFSAAYDLEWQTIPFRRGGGAVLPEVPGFYCFVVGCAFPNIPPVYFPLYAGETDNLRRRYGDYVREKTSDRGRVHVKKFLKVFAGEAEFTYAPFAADAPGRRVVEKKLNDALMPHYSVRDFSAEVRAERLAW